ncbi:MAG TPA: type I DNA topoisomerase, partial [Clostridiales bacterium]|nr:type I DNA topoisomerase [Clostridiales bacterium]
LATDPDREGEAISWHLQEVLGIKDKAQRIVFNEISERAVKNALAHPRDINYNLVDSQQARRVLDRLVGYKLSPFLCKKIKDGLSAGRVQSVALKMVVDREREIQAFEPKEYWLIYGEFGKGKHKLKALLSEKNGKKYRPANKEEAESVYEAVKNGVSYVKDVKKSKVSSHPLPPFTTSTLQQDASAKLSLSAPQVMSVAQYLYEGIETPEGHKAFVTYIRTDSVRVSDEAQKECLQFIREKYGDEYVPEKPNYYKSKKTAQDAHEAIRPIDVTLTPEKAKSMLDKNQYGVYKLIYDRFVASQMANAEYDVLNVSIGNGEYTFKASGRTQTFKGFTAVYADFIKNADEEEVVEKNIPALDVGENLVNLGFEKEQKFTKPPVRHTDASLVKLMEEKGIGRPSTYSTIISVLSKRKYTKKEGKYIYPTEVAFTMTDVLCKYFKDIMDVSFTANMEDKLDDIENGGKDWHKLIAEFYPPFMEQLAKANSDGDEPTDIICEKCGAPMVRKTGKYGKFLACSNYPACSNIKSENVEVSDVVCEKCGALMVYKNGKYGKFLACPNYPACNNIKSLSEEKSTEKCEKCGGDMILKVGKYGKYLQCEKCKATKSLTEKAGVCPICHSPTQKMTSKTGKVFYGCSNYPKCNFMSWDMPLDEKCPKCGKTLYLAKDGKTKKCEDKNCGYVEGKPAKKAKKVDKNDD